ncbi:gamma-glutamyltransferase family protein [Devosia aquimaris]|uniref:gamma-glutamyltransferase family protein n=1 Tax=Devosia aquimaris TaxID=2866214 RepID=UPI001CD140F8|nr:gamma-glutamyltransferase [Devosia sp. CJK-A8-3]
MLETALGFAGAFTAPHRAAALTGRDILKAGGSAVEAMVAAAATIAVAYPHMNGLGGDAFWIIHRPGHDPVAISGAGRAAALATPERYAERGLTTIPARGPDAALVVPGAVATWQAALAVAPGRFSLGELLADAIALAKAGVAVTPLLAHTSRVKAAELRAITGFSAVHQPGGQPHQAGDRFVQSGLAATLEQLVAAGLDDFYRGDLAATHGAFLDKADSPLRASDFATYRAETGAPLGVTTSAGTTYNIAPPTQGIATLIALAAFDRLGITEADGFAHIHGMVEATKRAYSLRNRHVADPDFMTVDPKSWLSDAALDALAAGIHPSRATPWPEPSSPGDTIWMGAADKDGTVVSFIQSLYWEYGSGLTCPTTGITFENRGAGFSLRPGPNQLAPGKRPFHTLNPGMARLKDGRVLSFGTQGGEGQPQTMTALYSRYVQFGQGLQAAITAPRWLLGTTWADPTTTLKLENRFDPALVQALADAGHVTETVGAFDPMMGNAGAVVHHASGLMEAATDPRSDGDAIAF